MRLFVTNKRFEEEVRKARQWEELERRLWEMNDRVSSLEVKVRLLTDAPRVKNCVSDESLSSKSTKFTKKGESDETD